MKSSSRLGEGGRAGFYLSRIVACDGKNFSLTSDAAGSLSGEK